MKRTIIKSGLTKEQIKNLDEMHKEMSICPTCKNRHDIIQQYFTKYIMFSCKKCLCEWKWEIASGEDR